MSGQAQFRPAGLRDVRLREVESKDLRGAYGSSAGVGVLIEAARVLAARATGRAPGLWRSRVVARRGERGVSALWKLVLAVLAAALALASGQRRAGRSRSGGGRKGLPKR